MCDRLSHGQHFSYPFHVYIARKPVVYQQYHERFDSFAAPFHEASNEILMGALKNELKADVRAEL